MPIIHVGDVWLAVRNANRRLFEKLFRSDLIHPSGSGQYTVAGSVYRTLYPTDLVWAPWDGTLGHTYRNVTVRINNTQPQYTSPNKRPVCDVSRDDAQRALCGCSSKKPVVMEPILNLLLH